MFCDADDMFYHTLALQLIIRECEGKKPDCFYSTFIEEVPDLEHPNKFKYQARQQAFVFVHGKVYRREFLIENEIYWDEELTLHEDGYFNGLALGQIKQENLVYCNEPFYMWCNNDKSVSRKTPTFVLDTYNQNLIAQDRLITKLLPKNIYEAINLTAIQLFQTYFLLTGTFKEWTEDEKNQIHEHCKVALEAVDKRFAEFYDKFKDCYRHVIQPERERLFASTKAGAMIFNNHDFGLKDFEDWLVEFKKKHNIEFDDTPIEVPKTKEPKDENVIEAEAIEPKKTEESTIEKIKKEAITKELKETANVEDIS